MKKPQTRLLCYYAGLVCILPGPAFAYLDPGTGSLILQSLIAVIAGAMVTGKYYWHQISAFFRKKNTIEEKVEATVDSHNDRNTD